MGGVMHVEGMWPYWMDGRDAGTVTNTLDLASMVLLTGALPATGSTTAGCMIPCFLLFGMDSFFRLQST